MIEFLRLNFGWVADRSAPWAGIFFVGCLTLLSVACATPPRVSRVPLAPPIESTALGPGDIFSVEIVGERDLPAEYQVASDGTVEFPYINTLKVAGLEPQKVAAQLKLRLVEAEILLNPSIIVRVREYHSKKIAILGQVKSPGSFAYQRGVTLVQAISQAGGLNSIAYASKVRLTRTLAGGGTRSVIVDFEAINAGRAQDIPLQAGDRIYVIERIF